ncbi:MULTISPECIES: zf-HC2 domain-containing protein [unclassified Paenibacillus]|uniref:zf-HC2 domain-containing protein n=1 Tax=unclassified Paenibacillus TaxID=185978 RepID=UPI00240767DD|nr:MULTISPECIES: zf-HC2 domain-containing protein [unclassified Paenibacillus]MDF9843319.1 cytoskeletal protein RodZ [Paenibacillus sp. PastF-2]MDF9849907.1 cytoskeletal protein RodZ [Paenibacillus sp. PastM-2]MDF9856615.1 cytoskeletal protein RodZ [Paenibacillus sp. PastF-1]MDH6481884.1 cytoskeletal protein RodZ [Paenibacillus sp. PastH-2]MDH6509028.1 cytoskeletal protein RodZ [Paenibacillus sp. PastM-3]
MKCTEVTEWMHRYLDHDLSPEETVEMYRHIDNCPSCAEVFDRLTLLSEQLEQLPDVKPPFSLVDSILPQLEQIDSGIRGSDAEVPEQDSKVVPMTRKGTHGKEAKGTSRAASMATRTGIGAVAAAVILLFAVFNMPERLPSADVEMSLNQAAETASSSEPLSKMNAADNADTTATGDEAGDASLYQMEIQPSEGADASNGGAAADTAAPSPVEAAPTAQSGAAAPAATESSSAKRNTPAARNTQAATPAPRADARVKSGNANNASDAQMFNSSEADMPADTADTPAQEPQQPPARQEAGAMGLLPALVSPHGSWSSPDGRYAAELAGQQLVIYSLPADGQPEERTAVTSLPLEGTWVSGSWSGDSLQFTYITMQDGVEVTEVYTAPASQATPAPSASPGSPATATPAPASTAPANK